VREEDCPFVADELVEVDFSGCSLSLEIGSDGTEAESVGVVEAGVPGVGIPCRILVRMTGAATLGDAEKAETLGF
jgi:hypothetical protein